MKNSNKHHPEKTASNGKGDISPKSGQIRCKCTHDCCCPNSKSYKNTTKKISNKLLKHSSPVLKKKVSASNLSFSKCPCDDRKVSDKKELSKSKAPCNKDQDCSCTLPTNTLSLRHKIADLDTALKTHGRGNKRNTKNVQKKSIQISEIYEDPETKKKSRITLTEKSKVKIQIKTFSDDTRKLEKNKKKDNNNKSADGSISSKSAKNEKKSKEKKGKEKKHKKKKKRRVLCCGKKHSESTVSRDFGSKQNSDVSVLFQTTEDQSRQPCKEPSCLGIKSYSKTEKTREGIVNTNTVVFPENFTSNLKSSGSCHACKEIPTHFNKQNKEIDNIRRSLDECLKLLKLKGHAVYMMSDMTQRSNPNYTIYSHDSNKYQRKSGKECKGSEKTYDPVHKVHDWMTHGSVEEHHESRDQQQRDERSHRHKENQLVSKYTKGRDVNDSGINKGIRTIDKFDDELEEYLKLCRREYQVYKSTKEPKSKASKAHSKKIKKSKKSKKGESEENLEDNLGHCDREVLDCLCGPDCANMGVQTSNISTEPTKSKSDKKAKKKEKKEKKEKKKKSKADDNTGDTSSIETGKSEEDSGAFGEEIKNSKDPKQKDNAKTPNGKKVSTGCFGKFIKCVLCRPY